MSLIQQWFTDWATSYGKPSKDVVMDQNELIAMVVEHLKHEEGFVPYVYDDGVPGAKPWTTSKVGKPTIGYGHLVKPGEQFTTLTEPAALELLYRDVKAHMAPLIPKVKIALSLNQWVMLVSHAFNAGPNVVINSTYFNLINENAPLSEIETWFKKYNKGRRADGTLVVMRGLVTRRAKEWALFADAVASNQPKIALA